MKKLIPVLILFLFPLAHFNGTYFKTLISCEISFSIVVSVLILFYAVCIKFKNINQLLITPFDIIVIAYFTLIAINSLLTSPSFLKTSWFINICLLFIAYFILKIELQKGLYKYLIVVFLCACILELIVSYLQLFGFIANINPLFFIGGVFGNPGALAAFIASSLPFILSIYLYSEKGDKYGNLVYILTIGVILGAVGILPVTESRGAWLASIAGMAFVLDKKYGLFKKQMSFLKSKSSRIIFYFALTIIVSLSSVFLYKIKSESAQGRILIWKISLNIIKKNPIWGVGYGNFEREYNIHQAQYFHTHFNMAEVMVADYVSTAYNEFLEIGVELGMLGLLLFVSLICIYANNIKKISKNGLFKNQIMVTGAVGSLIAVLVLAQTSYPFRIFPVSLNIIFYLAIISAECNIKRYSVKFSLGRNIALFVAAVSISIFFLVNRINTYLAGIDFFKAIQLASAGDYDRSLDIYKRINPTLNRDRTFLFLYASTLAKKGDYYNSNNYLDTAELYSSDPNIYLLRGMNYQSLKQYKKAEQMLTIASNITPSKFYPKYLLVKLFILMGERRRYLTLAKQILDMPAKIPSTAVDEIKSEMKNIIIKNE